MSTISLKTSSYGFLHKGKCLNTSRVSNLVLMQQMEIALSGVQSKHLERPINSPKLH